MIYSNELCRWLLKAENNSDVIRLRIADIKIQRFAACQADYLQILDGIRSTFTCKYVMFIE